MGKRGATKTKKEHTKQKMKEIKTQKNLCRSLTHKGFFFLNCKSLSIVYSALVTKSSSVFLFIESRSPLQATFVQIGFGNIVFFYETKNR